MKRRTLVIHLSVDRANEPRLAVRARAKTSEKYCAICSHARELGVRLCTRVRVGHAASLVIVAEVGQLAVVFRLVCKARVRSAVGKVATRAKKKLTESLRPLPIIAGLVGDAFRSP